MRKIRVLVKKPGETSTVEIVNNDLKTLQELVGGYIQVIPLSDILVICDEDGTMKQKPYNASFEVVVRKPETPVVPDFVINTTGRELPNPGEVGYYHIVGTFVLARRDKDEFSSLTDKDLKMVEAAMPKGP